MKQENTALHNYWKNHIAQWEQSGKSQTHYCKDENLSLKSFGYWKRKFSNENSEVDFIEIKEPANNHIASYVELIFPDGIIVRFSDTISSSRLKIIIQTLKA